MIAQLLVDDDDSCFHERPFHHNIIALIIFFFRIEQIKKIKIHERNANVKKIITIFLFANVKLGYIC